MKKYSTVFFLVMLLSITSMFAQTQTISGNITSDMTLTADKIYLMDGYVYVKNGASLTIEPGTIIKGVSDTKATLIITRGSKINAAGTISRPIVFTSDKGIGERQPSDWGGIVILGKAQTNGSDCSTCPGKDVAANEAGTQRAIEGDLDNTAGDGLYGGINDDDNSGVLTYVRIEFAGTVISPGNEINGLTMGGVGRGTTIHHVQTSFINDDGFEWFGGTVNAKHLISFRNIDDDFDTDFGYRGKVQFAIAMRDSMLDDKGSGPTTNGFESDNDGTGSTNAPFTEPVFSNVTIVGPLKRGKSLGYTNSFQNGARIRRNSGLSLFNSVIMGFPTGIFIDGEASANKFLSDNLILKNNLISGWVTKSLNAANSVTDVENKFFGSNEAVQSMDNMLMDPFNYTAPKFTVTNGSNAATGASFTGNKISDAFFTTTTYRGAFGTEDWAQGWANFNPQVTNYSTPLVGIAETQNNIASVNVYPNPAVNELNILVELEKPEIVTVSVYGIDGKLVNTSAAKSIAGTQTFNFDISSLNMGMYILKVNSASAQKNIRFNVVK